MGAVLHIPPKPETSNELNSRTPTELGDEDLLLLYCRTGRRQAFNQLVKRYERELYNYLRRYLGDAEMAEDAFQATFLQVHLKCSQFEAGRRFRPWLYAIATNQAIDARRRTKRHRLVSLGRSGHGEAGDNGPRLGDMLQSGETGPQEHASLREHRQWVQQQVEELPEALRSAVLLVYFEGMKYRDAAEALEVPVGTVKSRVHAAIQRLSEAWRRREPLDSEEAAESSL